MSGTSGRTPMGRRRLRTAAAVAAPLALVASGCGAFGASDETPELSSDSRYNDAVSAAEAPPPEGFSGDDFQGVKVDVPDEWSVDKYGGRMCVSPPGEDKCKYGSIHILPKASGRDPRKWPNKGQRFNKDDGWASKPSTCRSLDTWDKGDVGVKSATMRSLEGDGTVKLADGRKANHRTWDVTCDNGDTFEVRMWLLPQSDAAAYVWSADTQYGGVYDKVGESMNIDAYKKQVEKEKKEKAEKEKKKEKKKKEKRDKEKDKD